MKRRVLAGILTVAILISATFAALMWTKEIPTSLTIIYHDYSLSVKINGVDATNINFGNFELGVAETKTLFDSHTDANVGFYITRSPACTENVVRIAYQWSKPFPSSIAVSLSTWTSGDTAWQSWNPDVKKILAKSGLGYIEVYYFVRVIVSYDGTTGFQGPFSSDLIIESHDS